MKTKAKHRVGKSKVGALDGGALLWRCAVVFLFSHYLAQAIVLSLIGQESAEIIAQFSAYVAGVIVLQTVFCWAIFRWTARKKPSRGVSRWRLSFFAAVLTFNILGLFLSYTKFVGVATVLQVVILAALFGVLLEIFLRGNKALFVGLTLLGISANIELGIRNGQKLFQREDVYDNWRDAFPQRFQAINFKQTPNVYVIVWDSLIPSAVAKDYLNAPPPPYISLIKNAGGRIFKNIFTDRGAYPTPSRRLDPADYEGSRTFHSSLLILDPNMWERLSGGADYIYRGVNYSGQFNYFSGRRPSPLFEIFKENGYKIFVSYESEYFGRRGDYIDEYLIPPENDGQCRFAPSWYYFSSLGFCWFRRHMLNIVPVEHPTNLPETHLRSVLPAFRQHANDDTPWLHYVYVNSPGHAPAEYRHTPEHQSWMANQMVQTTQDTADYMRNILDEVRAVDPSGIVLFFGDHGAQLARHLYDQSDMQQAEQKRFYILDLHATVGAIYPADACASYMDFEEEYITTAMLMRRLVVCLAAGEDPIDWEVDYSSPYSDVNFEDYLYE